MIISPAKRTNLQRNICHFPHHLQILLISPARHGKL